MRSVSDVLQNKGGHVEYTTKDGKNIKVKYLTLKAMSQYENRLQNRAIKKLTEQKDAIPSDLMQDMLGKVMDNIASGHYAFGGEICQKSLQTIQGISDLISILCDVGNDEALDLLVGENDTFKMVLDEVVRKSISSKDDEVSEGTDSKNA